MMLGNLSVAQIEERLGIQLAEAERSEMESMRQMKATGIAPDKWHGFDFPFMIVCGSREMAEKLYKMLSPYGGKMKCQLQIGISGGEN